MGTLDGEENEEMAGGAITGIVIAVLFGVLVVPAGVFIGIKVHRKGKSVQPMPVPDTGRSEGQDAPKSFELVANTETGGNAERQVTDEMNQEYQTDVENKDHKLQVNKKQVKKTQFL